jgi:hypothetical protein
MSLRMFHLVFVLIAIIATDMFGGWAVWEHAQTHETSTLIVGLVSFALGFALVGYGFWVARRFGQIPAR